jgi:hypothetical protein
VWAAPSRHGANWWDSRRGIHQGHSSVGVDHCKSNFRLYYIPANKTIFLRHVSPSYQDNRHSRPIRKVMVVWQMNLCH